MSITCTNSIAIKSAALLTAALCLVVPFGLAGAQDAPQDPKDALESALDSAEYREFIEEQFHDAEFFYADHRNCGVRELTKRVGTEIRSKPQIDPDSGHIASVDLFDSWEAIRCGKTIQHNFTLWIISREELSEMFALEAEAEAIEEADLLASFADPDSVTTVGYTIPGTTIASDEIVGEIMEATTSNAHDTHFAECEEGLLIVNTEFAEEVKSIGRNKSGNVIRGKWGEYWTVFGCGREARYPVVIEMTSDAPIVEVFTKDVWVKDFDS